MAEVVEPGAVVVVDPAGLPDAVVVVDPAGGDGGAVVVADDSDSGAGTVVVGAAVVVVTPLRGPRVEGSAVLDVLGPAGVVGLAWPVVPGTVVEVDDVLRSRVVGGAVVEGASVVDDVVLPGWVLAVAEDPAWVIGRQRSPVQTKLVGDGVM